MNTTGHGGDIYSYIEKFKKVPLDFSANINPLGLPQNVKDSVCNAVKLCESYPDPYCRRLTKAISISEEVPQEYILCGNGAADLIFRMANAIKPRKVLVCAPTFAEYEAAVRNAGGLVEYYYLNRDNSFSITEDFLSSISDVDMVFVCNPNNPTGQITSRQLMLKIARRCAEINAVLVVDECFIEFTEISDSLTLKSEISSFNNIIILKAFTKIYAMAGIRLGYCLCSSGEILYKMFAAGQPWSVSTIAQECGIAALDNEEYIKVTKQLIKNEREFLIYHLTKFGFEVFGSHANYIFFYTKDMPYLVKVLAERNILIRPCSNFVGLSDCYFRVAVKDRKSNEQLISAISEIILNK